MRALERRIEQLEDYRRPGRGVCVASGKTTAEIEATVAAYLRDYGEPIRVIRIRFAQ